MGGAVSISAELRKEKSPTVFDLFDDKTVAKKMFDEIAAYGQTTEGMRGKEDKIDLAELILFITKEVNSEFTNAFVKNPVVIKQAFNFSMGSVKGNSNEMSFKEFKRLVPALLLFSHLWHIFEDADDNVSDGRIFKPEFIRAKQKIIDGKISGVSMTDIGDDDWAKEFDVINKTGGSEKGKGKTGKRKAPVGDDFISFGEFVDYVLKNVIKPAVYVKRVDRMVESVSSERTPMRGTRPSAFVRMMSDLIDDMVEQAQKESLAELEKSECEVEAEELASNSASLADEKPQIDGEGTVAQQDDERDMQSTQQEGRNENLEQQTGGEVEVESAGESLMP